jgi:dTDP-glucose 4,6-dehydratase|tara:strand:- start:1483 stop:1701 length:219 start_codon:yes stop_codon:yes gene_type:complete
MNILITGGLGFIGHNFIKYMFDHFEFNLLINIDKISYCSNNKYKFIKADINNKNLICFILNVLVVVTNYLYY